ncbi:MAG: hypothetical protein DCC58_17265 [Chloroflexi bacterium]|nr:MAG: hypothetical protein DCC58_17265 [Chloroflexota bacterium]
MPNDDRWQSLVTDPATLLGVLFDDMPMGIALFDREGILRAYNPTWADLIARYGSAAGVAVRPGLHLDAVLGPATDRVAWYANVYEPVRSGRTVRRDAVHLRGGYESGWLDFVHAPVREDGAIVGMMEVCVDVTERVLADERARHLAAIVESTNDAVVGGDLNGVIVSWNRGAERLYGYRADEAIGRSVTMLYPPGAPLAITDVNALAASDGRIEPFEARRRRADGTLIDVAITYSPIVDRNGVVVGVSSITRDITARKAAEAALLEREAQYRSIFESSRDGLAITAEASAQFVEVNPACAAMIGYSREEMLQMHWTAVVHEQYHQRIRELVPATLIGGDFRLRVDLVKRDGSLLPVEMHGVGFSYFGRPALLAVVRDISEQVHAMELLEARVAERTREITSLLEVSRSVATTLERDELLRLIFEQLNHYIVEYAGVTIWLVDGDTAVSVASTFDPTIQGQRRPLNWDAPPWQHIQSGASLVINDILADDPLARHYRAANPDLRDRHGRLVRTWVGVPLQVSERIIGMLAVTSAEAGFFTPRRVTLLEAIASQAAVAIENNRLIAEVQNSAALAERQRLARELHDSVSQALYGIALGAQTARALLDRDPARVAEPLDYVLSLSEAGLAEMRALIFELRPESLAEEGLVAALEKQTAALRARHRIDVQVTLPDEPDAPAAVEEALYRIAQEAMHNIVKHAKASRVDVQLDASADALVLEIRDDGRGFDPAADYPGHLGLRSMRERAARAGLDLTIDSAEGRGTMVRAVAPLR